MIGALWTGITGLASHQTALDNESHNIANVNTVGYKASRISFADQMYQDRIGKGSKILDAEKLYVQGNLKLTGVDYDMALSGDGFFTVLNTRSSGTAETLYTRAGNFRMGDNGTLQDAAGNEVQGWAMRPIDTSADVVSTNPNVTTFTNDYSKLLTSKVISHSTYIETITAKATDYTATAKADSSTIFEGAGAKSVSSKIADVEALVSNYSNWLSKLKDNPDGGSASSTAQVSQINFKSGSDALISKDGDQIYLYLDGNKISQNFIPTSSDQDFRVAFYNSLSTEEITDYGLTTDPSSGTPTDEEIAIYDREAGRIATYKALADNISEVSGFRAYMADESDQSDNNNDVLQENEDFNLSTSIADMRKGIIEIVSLIPGEAFVISEVGEVSGSNTVAGSYQTGTPAVTGTGLGALQSARDALAMAITGKQQDVYTPSELGIDGSTSIDFQYGITIYDKDMEKVIPVPGLNSTPATPYSLEITGATSIDDIVDAINSGSDYVDADGNTVTSSFKLSDYVIAKNINGNLVIETLDENFDVEFSGSLKVGGTPITTVNDTYTGVNTDGSATPDTTLDTSTIDLSGVTFPSSTDFVYTYDDGTVSGTLTIPAPADINAIQTAINGISGLSATLSTTNLVIVSGANTTFTTSTLEDVTTTVPFLPKDKNNDYSGRQGAGAEFIELTNTIDQTTTQSSLQLKLDTLGISDTAFGEFSVDSAGVITMKQDGAEFAIGQISIALFNNNRGLEPVGDNLLAKTNDSGEPIYNLNNDKTAKIEGQTLELSTADLSESLVNLMVFQRAFEANAKSITTSDELLNTLINLKR